MRPRTWMDMQVAVLAAGALFAWSIVATDLYRFTLTGGDLTQFRGTALPNPLLTACFYGALVLTVALRWAIRLQRRRDAVGGEYHLAWLLLAGTLFTLGSLAYQCSAWSGAHEPGGPAVCTGGALLDPLQTPCFVGFLFYLAGLLVTLIAGHSARRSRATAAADAARAAEPAALRARNRVA